ncbi:MAG: SpoIID/LytB domain-containing protein [Planctomycetota bacterium]
MRIYKQSIDRPTAYRTGVLWACVICMLTAAGCRRRLAEPSPGIDSPEQTWVRVLLFGNLRECTIASISGLEVQDVDSGTVADFRNGESFAVRCSQGVLYVGGHRLGRNVLVRPHKPHVFEIDDQQYRGYLQLRMNDDKPGFTAINHVPLESYLFGVVGAEMQSYWEPEALKAQAVASRTYCLYTKDRFGTDRTWDMTRSESTQVYGGLKAETATIRQVVKDTAGQILVCPNDQGRELIFPTFYSSSCGGHTEAADNVFGGKQTAALGGVACQYCRGVARRSHYYWKAVTLKMPQISERLLKRYPALEQKLETVTDFEVTKLGRKGRVIRVKLIGKSGKTDTVRGEDFRLSIDPTGRKIRSTIFSSEKKDDTVTFQNGLGFGHGVGLCQCGAQGMARKGKNYNEILEHYFPGSKLVTIETSIEP